jgi:transcriptional regulator with XRE-family HTH domain
MSVLRDTDAAAVLRDLREARGLSPEEVPHKMRMIGIDNRNIPSSRTIRRVEAVGIIPQVRYRFGLAEFYGQPITSIWASARKRVLA